jgi:hypothetical protein
MLTVPPFIVVVPGDAPVPNVFVPLNTRVPEPAFVMPTPAPPAMVPLRVSVCPAFVTVIVGVALKVMFRLMIFEPHAVLSVIPVAASVIALPASV